MCLGRSSRLSAGTLGAAALLLASIGGDAHGTEVPQCAAPLGSTATAAETRGVVLGVSWAPRPLRAGQQAVWTLRVTNTTETRRRLVFPTSQVAEVLLRRRGADRYEHLSPTAYRWSAGLGFLQAFMARDLAAGETWTCRLDGRLTVRPGRYELTVGLNTWAGASDRMPRPAVRRFVTVR